MSHRLADKKHISTDQMLILMFHFILGNAGSFSDDSLAERQRRK